MRLVIAMDYYVAGECLYEVIEDQDQHPLVGEKIVLSSGTYVVVDVAWMYSLETPNITVIVEPRRVE